MHNIVDALDRKCEYRRLAVRISEHRQMKPEAECKSSDTTQLNPTQRNSCIGLRRNSTHLDWFVLFSASSRQSSPRWNNCWSSIERSVINWITLLELWAEFVQYSLSSGIIMNIVLVMLLWCRASFIALRNSFVRRTCHVRHVHQHNNRFKTLQFGGI